MAAVAARLHSTRKLRNWQESIFASVLLGLLTVIFYWPRLVQRQALYWGDIGLYFGPMLGFLHDSLRAGHIPLWNPLVFCGAPYVGNPQTWPLYPFTAFLRYLDTSAFINWTVASHVWLAGIGTYLFLRYGNRRRLLPALLGAIVFAFGGQLTSKEQFPNMVQAAAYLPWILWLTQRLALQGRFADALLLGTAFGLQLLAAHAQIVMLTVYLAAAWGLFYLVVVVRPSKLFVRRLAGMIVLAAVVAVGLAAGQLLPTAELYRDAWRQRLSFQVVDRFYLPFSQLGNFVLPTLHGHPIWGDFTARGNFWETCCFVGWAAFVLAVSGAALAWRRRGGLTDRFWTAAFLIGLLLALGGQTWRGVRASNGLYWIAYYALPGFRSFHDPARCLLWSGFALAVLASAGLEAVLKAKQGVPRRRLVCIALSAVCFAELLHFGRSIYPLAVPETLHPITPAIAALQADPEFKARQARYLAPDTTRTWQRFTRYHSYRQAVPDYQSLWADTLTPNLMMPYGLPDAYGYDPVARRDTMMVVGTAVRCFEPGAQPRERAAAATWAGFLGVGAVAVVRVRQPNRQFPGLSPILADPTLPLLGRSGKPAYVYLLRNDRWQPRARLMTDFRSVRTEREAVAAMTDALSAPTPLDLSRTVVLTGQVPFRSVRGRAVEATISEDTPDRVVVTADVVMPSVLVLADMRHPGWIVTVNGREQRLLTADGCLRAVALTERGRCRVIFTDRPTSFRLGLYVTLLTLAALTAAGACSMVSRRKTSGRKKSHLKEGI